MNDQPIQMMRQSLWLVLLLSAPPILVASAAGLVVAVFQAATQLQESTMQYAVKFTAIVVTLFFTASLFGGLLYAFCDHIFTGLAGAGR
jgi:type III secretion protein S